MLTQDTDKKLFLIDAYALIYRSYYAFIRNPRINSKGMNTSAMFGFCNALLEILNKEQPTHLAVVFDADAQTERSKEFAAYKANREAMPEDIRNSIPWIKKIVEGFRIPMMEMPGFEADDVIGTLSKKADAAGFVTYMMTPDKDFAQLVTENVFMYKPGRFGNPPQVWGIPEVKERFSVDDPMQVIDILGLWGDTADNIPGIPGIGEKTAKKMVKKYGSVEGLIAASGDLKGKQKENVENFAEQGLLSKKLATIICDLDVEFDEKKLIMEEPDADMLTEVFSELEFRTMAKRVLNREIQASQPEGTQIGMFDAGAASSSPSTADEESAVEDMRTLETVEHKYHLVDADKDIDALIATLKKAEVYSFDTETSSLDALTANLVGMSFSVRAGEAYYVPTPSGMEKEISDRFQVIFSDQNKTVVGQNYKYDYKVMQKYGTSLKNRVFDTMVAHYLLNPDSKHGMDFLSETYLNYRPVSIESLIGKKGKNQRSMADLPAAEVFEYACEDADITFQLYERFKEEIKEDPLKKLFWEVETPLIEVLAKMEIEGVNIDKATLRTFGGELAKRVDELNESIQSLAGEHFNVDSPKQLGVVLFDNMQLTEKAKKTKTGQYVTSEDVLSKLGDAHEIIPQILEYRQLKKLKSTYVDPLPEMVNPQSNRLHTRYAQTVAATGRLSSNHPNLQNIPIRTEKGREIRKAFIPRDQDHVLLAADYSQVELRVIAALSGDTNMQEAFISGEDIHTATAARVFDVALADVDRDMRSKAKAVNFGIIYGQGAFGLAQNLNIKRGEAKEIIDNYFDRYPGIRQYMHDQVEFARKHGYVETILGRRRYLKDISSSNAVVRGFAERNAINAPIQGSAADVIKIAMINIDRLLDEKGFKSRMIMQVHDELVFDALRSEVDELQVLIKDKMEHAVKMAVPLSVEVDLGENWLQAH